MENTYSTRDVAKTLNIPNRILQDLLCFPKPDRPKFLPPAYDGREYRWTESDIGRVREYLWEHK